MAPKTLPDQAYLRECFDYDSDTGTLTWRARPVEHFYDLRAFRTWTTKFVGQEAGVITGKKERPNIVIAICGVKFLAHRIVWKLLTGTEPPEIDHWNGNELDNREDNLRPATRKTNALNARGHRDAEFQKGAYRAKKRWESKVMVDGVLHRLGLFDTPEEAHAAYCKAATELHGEFANFGEDRHSTLP